MDVSAFHAPRAQDTKAACDINARGFPSCTHLWSDIVGRATEGGRGDSVTDPLLAHSEVCQLAVALVVQQYVVQFEISERERERAVCVGRPGPRPGGLARGVGHETLPSKLPACTSKVTGFFGLSWKKLMSTLKICLMVPR